MLLFCFSSPKLLRCFPNSGPMRIRVLPWRSTCSLPQGMKSATSPSRNRDSDIFGCSAPPTASDTAATMPRST